MARRNAQQIAEDIQKFNVEGKVLGVHSNLSSIGLIAPSEISEQEKQKGLSPIAKTIINGFVDAVGKNGTFFVPTHSLNFIASYQPIQRKTDIKKDEDGNVISKNLIDDGYYNENKSASLVGALTQSVIFDDRSIRSAHPTHSICAIGKEAKYLVEGHTAFSQPVGIYNAFTKTIGLDGMIMFIGDTLPSNTSFHAYETLLLPKLAEYFVAGAAAEVNGLKRSVAQNWVPSLHRDFYDDRKHPTRAINIMRESGLLKEGKVGRGKAYCFNAKDMANHFIENVFPNEPDIMFCKEPTTCIDCQNSQKVLKHLYSKNDNSWDSDKIRNQMNKEFLNLAKPGIQRVSASIKRRD